MFEDGIANSLSDDKSSNHLNENSRTKVVSKRSVSDDSHKQNIELSSQSQSDESWWGRTKRSVSNFFWKPEDQKVVVKREAILDKSESADPSTSLLRRRRDYEDDDEDEDDESGSGVHDGENLPAIDISDSFTVTDLPSVKDDKYCKSNFLSHVKFL